MDVYDLGGGSGPLILHTGGANNIGVKKNHHTKGATKDCNIQCKNITKRRERAITGRRQHEMGRNRAPISPKKKGKFRHSPKWTPAVSL